MGFRDDFIWGVASSAIQTEGYPTADGGGESVWNEFCRKPGTINLGEGIDLACDSYHRYGEDIDCILRIGVRNYRFSTSWARIDPLGDGNWNAEGLAYYDRVVDLCLEKGIRPWVTLHHWELPLELQKKGGWMKRETAEAFARFSGMMAEYFKGRVRDYITINEPECILGLGHALGIHAPGLQLPMAELFTCWKNIMVAHGLSGRAIRAADPNAQIGLVSTGRLCWPKQEKDREAAREEMFALYDTDWTFTHNLVMDPACFGTLNTTPGTKLHELKLQVPAEEWDAMHFEPDFIGLNLYNGHEIYLDDHGNIKYSPKYPGYPRTALKWPVTPDIMDDSVCFIYERYRKPIFITECGLSCNDWVHLDGKVHDPDRIDFLRRYLSALESCTDRADIRGFFQWSLCDNFEWHSGYSERFGLVYCDYTTGKRTLKDSAYWYGQIAGNNGKSFQ